MTDKEKILGLFSALEILRACLDDNGKVKDIWKDRFIWAIQNAEKALTEIRP